MFTTDLADERIETCKNQLKHFLKNYNKNAKVNNNSTILNGIENETQYFSSNKFSVNRVRITNDNGEKLLQKKKGNYVTINIENINIIAQDEINKAIKIFANELLKLINFEKIKKVLVVGLGNASTTADSIGPNVIKNIEVTRHILKYEPKLLPKDSREISAITPGVLGTTGIETKDIVKSVSSLIKPDLIIVIDALATNNLSRILKTIQITDTGITPGSGVENKREELSFETLGAKVIAIGVPTVIYASTIVENSFSLLSEKYKEFDLWQDKLKSESSNLIKDLFSSTDFDLVVMPKEIDDLADNMQEIISAGINLSFK